MMSTCSRILFFLLLILSGFSHAGESSKKHLVYLGGGGEDPTKESTIFDDTVKKVGAYFGNNSDWNYQISFNGGHAKTDKIISTSFPKQKNKKFTADSFNKSLDMAIDKVDKELNRNDELVVWIDTHGGSRRENQLTHNICATGDDWKKCESLSIDEKMIALAEKARQKGVKLAIMDMSCHSGNTQALAKKYPELCVVSSTSEKNYAISYQTPVSSRGFSYYFANQLKKGKNLEDIFLLVREDHEHADLPQISTPEGMAIQDQLADAMSERLLFDSNEFHQLSEELEKRIRSGKFVPLCHQKTLAEMMNWSQSVLKNTSKRDFEAKYKNLINAVTEYDQQRKKIDDLLAKETDLNVMAEPIDCKRDWIDHQTGRKMVTAFPTISYTAYELLNADFNTTIKDIKNAGIKPEGTRERAVLDCREEIANTALAQRDRILKSAAYSENLKIEESLKSEYLKTESLADKVGTKERRLYDDLYKAMMDKNKSNPCRDFIL